MKKLTAGYRGYNGLQGLTTGEIRLQGVTKRLQGVTGGYKK